MYCYILYVCVSLSLQCTTTYPLLILLAVESIQNVLISWVVHVFYFEVIFIYLIYRFYIFFLRDEYLTVYQVLVTLYFTSIADTHSTFCDLSLYLRRIGRSQNSKTITVPDRTKIDLLTVLINNVFLVCVLKPLPNFTHTNSVPIIGRHTLSFLFLDQILFTHTSTSSPLRKVFPVTKLSQINNYIIFPL